MKDFVASPFGKRVIAFACALAAAYAATKMPGQAALIAGAASLLGKDIIS